MKTNYHINNRQAVTNSSCLQSQEQPREAVLGYTQSMDVFVRKHAAAELEHNSCSFVQ